MSSDILANPILNFVYLSAIDKQVLKLTFISFVDTDVRARGSLGISARDRDATKTARATKPTRIGSNSLKFKFHLWYNLLIVEKPIIGKSL